MFPDHPRWAEFIEAMSGPSGCNFREVNGTFKFDCDNQPNRPIARRVLAQLGFTPAMIKQSLGWFSAHGGFCDCEIVFNVESSFQSMMGRSRRRKNPTRRNRGTANA